jgi:FtsP/CotA-like multicopper oxidase with cupredoxin domain
MKLITLCIAGLALAAVAACGAAAAPGGPPAGAVVAVGEKDAGATVQARVGDTVRVTLEDAFPVPGSSLVWNVTSANSSVLTPGVVTRSAKVPTGPGSHETYTADFRATASGQSTLDAVGATSCEAMLKQSCPDRHFTVTVVITG